MAEDDSEVQDWFGSLSYKLKRELAEKIKKQADDLANAIRDAAPRGETGNLAESVKVRRKRNELDLEVTAGGDLTTKSVRGGAYSYDYALATEYGTQKESAQPFFYNTARQMLPEIQQNIEDAVEEVLSKA